MSPALVALYRPVASIDLPEGRPYHAPMIPWRAVGERVGAGLRAAVSRAAAGFIGIVRWWWQLWGRRPVDALIVSTALLGSGVILTAVTLRAFDPERLLVIAPFEVPSSGRESLSVTGRTVANLLGERIESMADSARDFRTGQVVDRSELAEVRVLQSDLEEVQVQAPTASLSPEWLQAQWSRFRRDRFIVRGDMVFSSRGIAMHARGTGSHRWKAHADSVSDRGLEHVMDTLASEILADFRPEVSGAYHLARGEYARAIEIIRRWQKVKPRSHEASIELGFAYYERGLGAVDRDDFDRALTDFQMAADWFESALELDSGNYAAMVGRGNALAWVGMPFDSVEDTLAVRGAIDAYESALRADPEGPASCAMLEEIIRIQTGRGLSAAASTSTTRHHERGCDAGAAEDLSQGS